MTTCVEWPFLVRSRRCHSNEFLLHNDNFIFQPRVHCTNLVHSNQVSYSVALSEGHQGIEIKLACEHNNFIMQWTIFFPMQKREGTSSIEQRVDSTRIDADELIDELIKNTDFAVDDSNEGSIFFPRFVFVINQMYVLVSI